MFGSHHAGAAWHTVLEALLTQHSPGHPDFGKPGNDLATTHGAWSPRLRDPLAAAIHDARMADPATPPWLRDDASYLPELLELARVEAVVELMWGWMSQRDLQEAITDTEESAETHREGRTARKSRRVVAVAEQYRRYATQASRMREGLGLTPRGRARLGKLGEVPRADLAMLAMQLMEQDGEGADGR
jgi:hypothetical protein